MIADGVYLCSFQKFYRVFNHSNDMSTKYCSVSARCWQSYTNNRTGLTV